MDLLSCITKYLLKCPIFIQFAASRQYSRRKWNGYETNVIKHECYYSL